MTSAGVIDPAIRAGDRPLLTDRWESFEIAPYGDLLVPLVLEPKRAPRLMPVRFQVSSPAGVF